MIRFLFSLMLVGAFCAPAEGQLFRRSFAVSDCPGGICPTVQSVQYETAGLASVQRVVTRAYPVRSSATWWTGCNSWQHMTAGEHAGQFDTVWLRSLSWGELQSLHSDAHEGRIQWGFVRRAVNRAANAVTNTVQVTRAVVANSVRPRVVVVNPAPIVLWAESVPAVQSSSDSSSIAAIGDGEFRERTALRLFLTRQALRGDADARKIRDSPQLFDRMLDDLQSQHQTGIRNGTIAANGDFVKWFIEWAAANPDQLKFLIELIISLFAQNGIILPYEQAFVFACQIHRIGQV